jgi:NADP-dependent 3-hydroxy acid dehydrogenase YdfG
MLKEFFVKQLIKRQMKGVPPEQQAQLIGMVEKNPELFMNIASEVQEKVKGGAEQMAATMEVVKKYQEELKKLV